MVSNAKTAVQEAFRNLGPRNPLKELNPSDRAFVWTSLCVYAHASREVASAKAAVRPIRELSQLGELADRLAVRLERDLYKGALSESLEDLRLEFADLPKRLAGFSVKVERLVAVFGTPGHEHKVQTSNAVVRASEFIRIKLGKYFDAHVAELLQAIAASRGDRSSKQVWEDGIRKKRDRLRKENASMYDRVCAEALRAAQTSKYTPGFGERATRAG